MNMICELYPTIITPFNEDLSIDFSSLDRLISLYAKANCDGIFAVCQSSEMFFLNDDEKISLADFSIKTAHKYGMKCVISGHTQENLEEQIRYLRRAEAFGADAIILLNNRLADKDESEAVLLQNLTRILSSLNPQTRLGIYECPYPYKRFITEELINAIIQDGRFDFIKDTCCKADIIARRIKLLEGSSVKLFNANAATLYETLMHGAHGYSGIMLNMISDIFKCFKEAILRGDHEKAQSISDLISAGSVIECQNYPSNAKYALMQKGVLKTDKVRNGKSDLTESQRKEMDAFIRIMDCACRHFS